MDLSHTNPQDIPDRSQPPEAILVQRPSGVVEEPDQWLDDDWWEDLESIQANEGGGNDLGGDNTEFSNPLPGAEDGPQEHHLEQDPSEQPTRSGDTTWHSVPGIDVRPPGSDVSEDESAALICPAFAENSGVRMAYLQAAIANVFMHASVINATSILNTMLNILDAAGTLPFHP